MLKSFLGRSGLLWCGFSYFAAGFFAKLVFLLQAFRQPGFWPRFFLAALFFLLFGRAPHSQFSGCLPAVNGFRLLAFGKVRIDLLPLHLRRAVRALRNCNFTAVPGGSPFVPMQQQLRVGQVLWPALSQ